MTSEYRAWKDEVNERFTIFRFHEVDLPDSAQFETWFEHGLTPDQVFDEVLHSQHGGAAGSFEDCPLCEEEGVNASE